MEFVLAISVAGAIAIALMPRQSEAPDEVPGAVPAAGGAKI
jgi:hypothetical protein